VLQSEIIRGVSEVPVSIVLRGDSLYAIVDGASWTQAEANAVALGGHLVTINDSNEYDWYLNQYQTVGDPSFWIGLTDQSQEASFQWISGERSTWKTSWRFGQPDNGKFSPQGEDHVQLFVRDYIAQRTHWLWKKGEANDLSEINRSDLSDTVSRGIAELPIAFSITRSRAVKEGGGLFATTLNLSAGIGPNLVNGSTVYWTVDGVTQNDLRRGRLAGSGVIINGRIHLKHSLRVDSDAGEMFRVSVYSDSAKTQQIGTTSSVVVQEMNSAPTDIIASVSSFDENIKPGTAIASLTTTDPDPGDTFSYRLVRGLGSNDNHSFVISGDQIKIKTSPNYELKNSYSIRVRSTDKGRRFYEKNLIFTVSDLQDSVISSESTVLAADQYDLVLTGTGNVSATGNALNNTIAGNSGNNNIVGKGGKDFLAGRGGRDLLTGRSGRDSFVIEHLTDSLLAAYDVIRDYQKQEKIIGPGTIMRTTLTTAVGAIPSLTQANISTLLTPTAFPENRVAAFTVPGRVGTFLAMNDGQSGFNASSDAIVYLSNYMITPFSPISIL
jgi:hypothetical protein